LPLSDPDPDRGVGGGLGAAKAVVEISDLGAEGDGVAELDGARVFVPGALAGEQVAIAAPIEGRAALQAVLRPSPMRRAPICPLFADCGSCAVQHAEDVAIAAWKTDLVRIALRRVGIEAAVEPIRAAWGAGRRRLAIHARRGSGPNGIVFGFAARASHRFIEVGACPVLTPTLEAKLPALRAIAAFLMRGQDALTLHATDTETGIEVDLRGFKKGGFRLAADELTHLSGLARAGGLVRVTIDGGLALQIAAPIVRFGRAAVELPPRGFLQATKAAEDLLGDLAMEAVAGAKSVADLFCGAGAFSFRLAERAKVLAVDSAPEAIAALEQAARHVSGLKPITAIRRDLFRSPLSAKELGAFDAVVFDPPRAGAEAQARQLASARVAQIAAISCAPTSFARDAKILIDGGYRLTKVAPIDQFRFAAHVELAARFERK